MVAVGAVAALAAPQSALAYKINDQASVGLDIRWRGVMFDNMWNFDDDNNVDSWEFHRFRSRVWLDLAPLPDLRAYVRLANEYRWGDSPEELAQVGDSKEIFLDNAFIEMTGFLGTDFNVKVGRQDLMYGEGFVLLDGSPNMGSTTIAFDAAKITYTGITDTTMDFIMAKPYEDDREDADDEDLYGVYAKTTRVKKVALEPYALYKKRGDIGGGMSPEGETLVLGVRGTGSLVKDVDCVAELTFQDRNWIDPTSAAEEDDSMVGGYARAQYMFSEASTKPRVWGEFVYLPTHWDSMYAEWPKYSELLIYTVYDGFPTLDDPDEGSWVNMRIYSLGAGFTPKEKTDVSLTYRMFDAISSNGAGGGNERGDLLAAMVNHTFNDYLTGHVLVEWFDPGDYYGAEDEAYFARFQLMFKY